MAVTSVPKMRLVSLILDDLAASDQVVSHFNIKTTAIEDRLMSFNKDELLTFIATLGQDAEEALGKLETAFPLRRPPTLYISFLESKPEASRIISASRSLAKQGRKGGMDFENNAAVRFIYMPQSAVTLLTIKGLPIVQWQLQYEYQIEYVEANEEAENYGQLVEAYSLETAFVWLPLQKYNHAIIACCDYPVLRRIRNFLKIKLGIELNPPCLDKKMLEQISQGSIPRSVTYSLQISSNDTNEVQHVTISDPLLQSKPMFRSITNHPDREQMAGFYTAHPGLALGGIGVARRDGKIWTPHRLDINEISDLAVAIIEQTESELFELAKAKDFINLTKYYYTLRVTLGGKELNEKTKEAWGALVPLVFQAQQSRQKEQHVPLSVLNKLINFQKPLKLLVALEYECTSCNIKWLSKCPECHQTLTTRYEDGIQATCPTPNCRWVFDGHLECECGQEILFDDLATLVRIIPEEDCNKSIQKAAKKYNLRYHGIWEIWGLTLRYFEPRKTIEYPRLSLTDFQLWKKQGKLEHQTRYLSPPKILSILNKTKEKCRRDGTVSSDSKCGVCKNNPLNPKWITKGDTCLLRLFGLPIGLKFDGVHHGHEKADLRYQDILISNQQQTIVWIHVKSRSPHCPPQGMGRSTLPIQELYKQTVYSAFEAATNRENVHVIGIAIPNLIKTDVIESMAYTINTLGFTFLVVEEKDWQAIISSALEQAEFEFIPSGT